MKLKDIPKTPYKRGSVASYQQFQLRHKNSSGVESLVMMPIYKSKTKTKPSVIYDEFDKIMPQA